MMQMEETVKPEKSKDIEEQAKREAAWYRVILSVLVSFLVGAFVLSLFSVIQKLIMHEAQLVYQSRSYIVPVFYGGLTGSVLGFWYARLKEKQRELLEAYNATLEGWARAVEMRDQETQDHTDRVIRLVEGVARMMGISGAALEHIRRGALVHDIGKIGIPDSVLNKPGPLSADERAIMEQHPLSAMKMLEDIAFLRPAMEIPCCHHERWDGSGYPHGFKGEEIPLAARIFAVVDVWDALTNDRPYRKAWTRGDALNYIEGNAGELFDPEVVRTFLDFMRGEGYHVANKT